MATAHVARSELIFYLEMVEMGCSDCSQTSEASSHSGPALPEPAEAAAQGLFRAGRSFGLSAH